MKLWANDYRVLARLRMAPAIRTPEGFRFGIAEPISEGSVARLLAHGRVVINGDRLELGPTAMPTVIKRAAARAEIRRRAGWPRGERIAS